MGASSAREIAFVSTSPAESTKHVVCDGMWKKAAPQVASVPSENMCERMYTPSTNFFCKRSQADSPLCLRMLARVSLRGRRLCCCCSFARAMPKRSLQRSSDLSACLRDAKRIRGAQLTASAASLPLSVQVQQPATPEEVHEQEEVKPEFDWLIVGLGNPGESMDEGHRCKLS